MFERFTQSARAAVEDARTEAGRRGDRRIGTEHLLLALLHDEELAGVVGIEAASAHEAANELDRAALAAIGLDLGTFSPTAPAVLRKSIPLTAGAKTVLRQTLAQATAEKAKTISARHIMLALLDQHEPDPAAALFAALSVDTQAARARLAAAA